MVIREGSITDASSINKLLTQLGYPQDAHNVIDAITTYNKEGYHLLVCEVEGIIIGFASLHWFDMFHVRGKMGRITAICIDEGSRSHGIGARLMLASEEFLKAKGCVKVEVTSNLKRTLTHQFYLKIGYSIDSKRFIKELH